MEPKLDDPMPSPQDEKSASAQRTMPMMATSRLQRQTVDKIPPPTISLPPVGLESKIGPEAETTKTNETDLEISVRESRTELRKYLEIYNTKGRKEADKMMSKEKRAICVVLAKIDADGDGLIPDEEFERYEMDAKEHVEGSLNLLLNVGVVAALILSITYPLAIAELTPSDASSNYFSQSAIAGFTITYYILIIADVLLSLMLIYLSLRVYLYMGFWISDTKYKLEYLRHSPIPFIAGSSVWNLRILLMALPFGVVVNTSPHIGIIALVLCVLFTMFTLTMDAHYGRGGNKSLILTSSYHRPSL